MAENLKKVKQFMDFFERKKKLLSKYRYGSTEGRVKKQHFISILSFSITMNIEEERSVLSI